MSEPETLAPNSVSDNSKQISNPLDDLNNNSKLNDSKLISQTSQVDGLYRLFRTDKGLSPSEISALLGIEVQVKPRPKAKSTPRYNDTVSTRVNFIVLLIAMACASIGIIFAMHQNEIGPFHQSNYISSY